MFDRVTVLLKKYVFWEGVVVGLLLCHMFYSQFLTGRIKEGHDAEVKVAQAELRAEKQTSVQLQKELQKREDYEQKYQAEAVARATAEHKVGDLEADYQALQRRYDNLTAMKWEEKYNAEKLAKVASDEERAILKSRLTNANEQVPKADPFLVKQLEMMAEQNKILAKERDDLRKLYTASVAQAPPADPPPVSPTTIDHRGKALLASLSGVTAFDAADTIIKGVGNWGGPVDGETFIKMLDKVQAFDRARVVVQCAPYLQRPLSELQIQAISAKLIAFDAGAAMNVLMKEQMKHK